ncbi:MAG TPA: Cys-tRNA(Pro) deacylase [Polyangiaceae bacterium]|nr:Cys-tRNA(Pro) deacylase [Polyangiaceae bacterium]
MKTNAARILDGLGIPYELAEYQVDPEDLSAVTVARKVGMEPERVFKTLVARGDRHGVCLALVPAHLELDLKALARATDNARAETVPLKDVLPLTGYVRGGVSALGCKKAYPVICHESMLNFDRVAVSAGVRGTQILLSPQDYVRAVKGRVAPIARPEPESPHA